MKDSYVVPIYHQTKNTFRKEREEKKKKRPKEKKVKDMSFLSFTRECVEVLLNNLSDLKNGSSPPGSVGGKGGTEIILCFDQIKIQFLLFCSCGDMSGHVRK